MTRTAPSKTTLRQRGLSLVECLITLSIATVVVGSGLPGFSKAMATRQLEGAAAQLETDIQFVRSLAVAGNRSLHISFAAGAGGSCYVVHSGAANACRCDGAGSTACAAGAQPIRTVAFPASGSIRLQSNVASITFAPDLGTSTPTGTLRVVSDSGAAIHQIVNVMGRVRSCSPAPGIAGMNRC